MHKHFSLEKENVHSYCILKICSESVACTLGTLTTWGVSPEVVTLPVGGRFLLVTDAHEKACVRDEIRHIML